MSIGERIQKYRKSLNLSQEELGQKLLVSRQTISLWEKDQTVPTIDNLMRLKEIFGVSVDEILGFKNNDYNFETKPNEEYQFNFTKTELNEIHRLQRKNIFIKPAVFAFLSFFLFIFFICSSAPDIMTGFTFGVLLICIISHIKEFRTYNKAWKNSIDPICKSTYEYKIFDNYLIVNIYRNSEKVRESKHYFSDIDQLQQFGKWIFLQSGGQSFIIRKNELKENSAIYSYMYKNPSKTVENITTNKWRVISIILFIASLLSIFGALVLVGAVSSKNGTFDENMWLFFLLTPIPIASIVLGFILKSKGYRHKKNLIVGIIMTAVLCIYGAFSFILSDVYDHSDEPIIRAEQITKIDIPEHKQINTQNFTKSVQSDSSEYIYYISDIFFDTSVVDEFKKNIITDNRWLSPIPSNLIGITSPFSNYNIYDYVLIYNIDTSEYNALPNDSGTFRFINILYRSEDNQMRIVEYDIDYVK